MASANFYNDSAKMIGLDLHHAYILSPLPGELTRGHRIEPWPYVVYVSFSDPGGDDAKRTPKVTADGQKMIRDGFVHHNVNHRTFVPLEHPVGQPNEVAKIQADSTTTPLLKAASVTSAGDPLSIAVVWALGANLNCQDDGVKMTGFVRAICSVQTSPRTKDAIFRLFDDFFKKMLIDWLNGLIDKLLTMRKVPKPIRALITWLTEKAIKMFVEWLELLAKWAWDKAAEPPKLPPPDDAARLGPPEGPATGENGQNPNPSWYPGWLPHM